MPLMSPTLWTLYMVFFKVPTYQEAAVFLDNTIFFNVIATFTMPRVAMRPTPWGLNHPSYALFDYLQTTQTILMFNPVVMLLQPINLAIL